MGAHYGFREAEFVVAEGQSRDVGHDTNLRIELDAFRDRYSPLGIAESYEAEISIYDGDKLVRKTSISPNHPVSYRTTTIYQSGFGNGAKMRITDAQGNEVFYDTIDVGLFNYLGNPEAPAGFVTIPAAGMTLTVVAPDTNPANEPELDQLQLKNGQMYVRVQPVGGSVLAPQALVLDQGQPAQIGEYTITFEREVRWANLQVGSNPGIPIFIIAAILLVGGLVVTFYFPLRRIRGMVSPTAEGSSLIAVPLAKRDWSGKRDFFAVSHGLGEALGRIPIVKRPAGHDDWDVSPGTQT